MKMKKLFLSLVLMMSMLFAVACKDKSDPETPAPAPAPVTKTDPTVSVSVEDRVYLIGESLSDIELIVASGSTSGSVEWDDEDYVLVQGENTCAWTFTPTDTEAYNSKTGSITITAIKLENPTVNVSAVEGQTVYIDARYETITLQATASFEGQPVTGQIVWTTPNATFVEGNNVCEWKFIPTESTTYAVVTGTIELEATVSQTPVAISISENTKTSYLAFDTIDKSALTVCLVYDGGKVEEISDIQNVNVTYNTTDSEKSLRVTDTSVTLSYTTANGTFTTPLTGLTVNQKPIANPTFNEIVVYSGNVKTLTLAHDENSGCYTYTPLQETNADVYDLVVTLIDDENFIWANGDETTTIVKCEILKADLVADEEGFSGEYDGEEHFASVEVLNETIEDVDIYYSLSELDETNYGSASKDIIKKINAGTYTIYYYMEGDTNHNGKSGSLTIEITKQTPTMTLDYCYTLATGGVVNYPTSYVSIVDKQSNPVSTANLEFVYYTTYSDDSDTANDVKTTTANGATVVGGAPKNDRATEYYVVVKFVGSENYNAVEDIAVLFIEGADLGLYAKGEEDKFAFKYEENGFYAAEQTVNQTLMSNNGSNAECNAYLEFKELEVNADGLKLVKFDAKFGEGAENIREGRLVYFNGKYHLLDTNGLLYPFAYNSSNEELAMEDGVINAVTLVKWEFANYLKTFSAQTVLDADYNAEKNTSKNTTITFYNDYGTIRFSADVNLKYSSETSAISGTTIELGGHREWAGAAVISFERIDDGPLCYTLSCYIINSDSLESSGYPIIGSAQGFKVHWTITSVTGENEPTSVKLHASIGALLTNQNTPEYGLIGQTFAEVVED